MKWILLYSSAKRFRTGWHQVP